MRKIDSIIIHCSATKAGMDFSVEDVDRWHRDRGMDGVGYHYVIRLDGSVEKGRSEEQVGAHCLKWNGRSVGICYIGGLDAAGQPADTRTDMQKKAMRRLIEGLRRRYRIVAVMGHRDTSPDLNGDGVIEPNEFIKWCPCFDVRRWLAVLILPLLLSACGSSRYWESRYEEMESVATMTDNRRLTQMQKAEQETLERMNGYLEETVVVWQEDTAKMNASEGSVPQRRLCSVMRRRVTERKTGVKKETSGSSLVEADSCLAVRDTLMKTESREEKQVSRKGRWWKWGGIIVLLMGSVLFFRKFFLIDNQWVLNFMNKKVKK